MNPSIGDLHLLSTATVAIDKVAAISAVTNDIDGDLRPQGSSYDIGADEYTGTVTPPPSDTTAPSTSITAPSSGTTVSGTVAINASATDNVGVTNVEFYVDGTLKGTDTSSPYSYSWDTTNGGTHACNGAHTHNLTTRATDAAGNMTTSSGVSVNMNNPAYCTTTPPPSTKFIINDRVQATASVQVRSTPAGTSLGTQSTGMLGTVVGGPTYAQLSETNYWWWNINFDSGVDGWVAEDFLLKVVGTPTPPPEANLTISNVTVSVRKGTATFLWDTNQLATSQVNYGVTTNYGQSTTLNSTLQTVHIQTASGLLSGYTYNYQVVSANTSGTVKSPNLTFRVGGKPPKVTNLSASSGSIILNWSNPSFEGFSSVSILRSTSGYVLTYDKAFEIAKTSSNTYRDTDVTAGVTYYYSLFVFDNQENTSDPATVSFVAPAISADQPVQEKPPVTTTSCVFTRDLRLGSRGEDVRCLQRYLNSVGFTVSSSGLGSVGNESTYFGFGTASALSRWQRFYKITPSTGYFGSKSRAKYVELVR